MRYLTFEIELELELDGFGQVNKKVNLKISIVLIGINGLLSLLYASPSLLVVSLSILNRHTSYTFSSFLFN